MEPVLRAVDLTKSFGTLQVVSGVSFDLQPGEVLGIAGESGSGKSTLCLMLTGLYTPDRGTVLLEGRPVRSLHQARTMGLEAIHQNPDIAERLDIVDNVFLGREVGWPPRLRWLKVSNRRRMEQQAGELLEKLGVEIDSLHQQAGNLSGERRQLVAIARTMTHPFKVIVIDNPSFLLSYRYQQRLLSLIQEWRQDGVGVLYSSNNVDNLLAVTDRIIVLRKGRVVTSFIADNVRREDVVAAMVGMQDRRRLTPIIWALDSYYRAREQAERLQQGQTLLEMDLPTTDSVKGALIDQLAQQIDALDSANIALQDAQRRLLDELEQERKYLAREIHDEVIQDLLGVNYQLEEIGAEDSLKPRLSGGLQMVRSDIRRLVDDLRHICGNLRPPTIDSLGLGAAIQSYTLEWSERTGIGVRLDLDDHLGRLPETIELPVFRIVQESLNNVRKHAEASEVKVSLQHTNPRTLMLSVADDGQGMEGEFDLSELSEKGHYGLLGISERVALLGGRVRFQNRPEGGLLIQAEIPHPRIDERSTE